MAEYIKRDELAKWIKDESDSYSTKDVAPVGWILLGLVNELHKVPTADVVERKHGKWKAASEDLIICTSCKCGFLLPYPNRIEEAKTVYGWNFCPNCGADMRGEEDGNIM